ncbi:flagellar hook capping FlgD N-terminal domain-containing protein [Roseinatronobacter sp.]|uniref:flagellar hook capping FlgD N-terminal domain-containing protein n=1 Tax=Roseinatronobacter sp. TaxID=1945755 RepID=UPI0025E2278C|nr:flagellar hook capping FlgD N-terminal domain-containing protein [Rhodobaca sp.]
MELQDHANALSSSGRVSQPRPIAATQREISSDFETFLRMLTVQMQNQNPLEPIEASDFAVQLATFSGVEQQVRTNDLLTQMMSKMGLSELSEWIDREVLTAAPKYVDGSPMRFIVPENPDADYAELVFQTGSGTEKGRFAASVNRTDLEFTPPDYGSADYLDAGLYTVKIEWFNKGVPLGAEPALSYSKVAEARMDEGTVKLVLEHGHSVASTDILGVRR